jgi:3-oxoacyl-[acyl-carrier protein] reductase
VCASSRGLGKACAMALAQDGVDLVVNGRDAAVLEASAAEIRKATGVKVTAIAADVSTADGQAALLAACPDPDILVNNNAGPPFRDFRDLSRQQILDGMVQNMVTPIELIQKVLPAMVERRFGRIVNITSAMVKAPLAPMGLSTGARAGLTSLCKALSREVAHANITINNLLPERIDTDRQRMMAQLSAGLNGYSVEEAYDKIRTSIAARRLGRPEELGAACAFLCSAHAGFISGQNLQLDGGSYPGVM